MRKYISLLLVIVLFNVPNSARAWGLLGHRIVCLVAESYLTPEAKAQIQAIIGNSTLAMESNWPDFIKSDSTYNYLNPWHYMDLEDGLNYSQLKEELKKDTAVDAYTKLRFLIKELKNKNLTREKKLFYLRLLIHITGDLHQPLHVGHDEDQGGNKISVMWFGVPSNLHRVWDESLVEYQQLSYTEYTKAINYTTKAQRLSWQHQPMEQWIFESYILSRGIYAEITRPDQKLSYRYNFLHIQDLNNQLLKGGVRLAGLLNEIFGTKAAKSK